MIKVLDSFRIKIAINTKLKPFMVKILLDYLKDLAVKLEIWIKKPAIKKSNVDLNLESVSLLKSSFKFPVLC